MAVSIGKRKRQEDEDESASSVEDEGAMRALFQRQFEAKFKPLERPTTILKETEPVEETRNLELDGESDWSGLSDDEDPVETVHHDTSQTDGDDTQQHERKVFMSSKPPSSHSNATAFPKKHPAKSDDDPAEAANLKNDLALQRLLKESHLLDPTSSKESLPTQNGKGRLKALDLRLKDLGAKEYAFQQQKMPLSHRKGITSKAADREQRRRKEALENGVVLEKFKHTSKGAKYRDKGVGGSAVGKFRGGTLKLNSRDLRSIQGDRRKKRR